MSAYWTILESIKANLEALAGFATVDVVVRKRPFHSADHGDGLPFVCLAPTSEIVAGWTMPNTIRLDYPVVVAIFQARGSTLADPVQLQWQLDRREDVRLTLLREAATGVLHPSGFDYDPQPAFDLAGLAELFDVSLQLFTYRIDGPRSTV